MQQVANRVAVLGAIQSPEGLGAAGVKLGRGSLVELRFKGGDERNVGALVGAGNSGGRHIAGAQAANHFFPGFGMLADRLIREGVQLKPGRLGFGIMTANAVAADECTLRSGSGLRAESGGSRQE